VSRHAEVLVFGSVNDLTLPKPFLDLSRSFARNAGDALDAAGLDYRMVDTAEPLPSQIELREAAARGLVLLGGGDVDPALYGHTDPVPSLYGVHPEVDAAAIDLIRHAIDAGIPVLAICRGAQLVNVALGGTLIPDIERWETHRGGDAETVFIEERIRLEANSRIARILGADDLTVMNGHHQAIDRLGEGVSVTGRAVDGIVESIEVDHAAWLVGMQWHPEHDRADAESRAQLFGAFGAAVSERAVNA